MDFGHDRVFQLVNEQVRELQHTIHAETAKWLTVSAVAVCAVIVMFDLCDRVALSWVLARVMTMIRVYSAMHTESDSAHRMLQLFGCVAYANATWILADALYNCISFKEMSDLWSRCEAHARTYALTVRNMHLHAALNTRSRMSMNCTTRNLVRDRLSTT